MSAFEGQNNERETGRQKRRMVWKEGEYRRKPKSFHLTREAAFPLIEHTHMITVSAPLVLQLFTNNISLLFGMADK